MPKLSDTYNLEILHPDVASQWHPSKNGALTPRGLTPGSGRKIWWKCSQKHEWEATVSSRTKGSGCPHCYRESIIEGTTIVDTGLLVEWHPSLNPGLNPRILTTAYNRKLWWLCRNGHEWQATLRSRVQGSCCPICEPGSDRSASAGRVSSDSAAHWERDPRASLLNLEEDYVQDSYADTDFRTEKRYPYHAAVMTENAKHENITYALLKDFSSSGMHIETDYPLPDGEKVFIRIKEKITASSPTSFECRVRWCKPLNDDNGKTIGYRVGLQFIDR